MVDLKRVGIHPDKTFQTAPLRIVAPSQTARAEKTKSWPLTQAGANPFAHTRSKNRPSLSGIPHKKEQP